MKKLIIANWKMNPQTPQQAVRLFYDIRKGAQGAKNVKVVIAAPFVFISRFKKSRLIELGAQDVFWADEGAFTGEISPRMLKSLQVRYVILGHSERREHVAETNPMINKKVKAALQARLKAVLCVGERDRSDENFHHVVRRELQEDLEGISKNLAKNLIIAYEPIWAIGTGKPVKFQDLFEMVTYIRRTLLEIFSRSVAHETPILYGGSVNAANARTFLEIDGVDGLLVGGASLLVKEFNHILRS